MRTLFLALGVILVLGLWGASAQQPPAKQPIPAKKALDKAEDLVNDIFKDEISKANDAELRAKLAAYLLQQGDECGDDPAARYVLYRQAADLAVLAGNAKLTLTAIDKLALYFDVPGMDLKAQAAGKLVDHVPTKEPSKALTELALTLITEALDADNYDAATTLGKAATLAARKAQDVPLVTTVDKRNAEIQAAKAKFSVLQPFVDRLKKDPADALANEKLGEYFGLFKGKWDRAIPHLAKSNTEPLASLAKKDLSGPQDTKDQLALADAWWDFAIKQPEPQQIRIQERAAFWYDKALPTLSGLSRTKAQKRFDQVAARSQGTHQVADGPVGFIKGLDGHAGEIRALAISSDGRFALSGSADNSMRLWDLQIYKEIQAFRGHSKQVYGVAFVPGGKSVLSASWDGAVKLWDITSGNSVHTFSHPQDVNAVTVSGDGRWMLTGCDDKHMRLWDLVKQEEVRKFPPHSNFCYACAFAPNGLQAASGGNDRRAMVCEIASGKVIREVEQSNPVTAVAFSSDSRYLFTCGDSAIHIWDIATGSQEKKFETASPSGLITAMALTADGKRMVIGGEDKTLRVWDVATGKEVAHFQGHTGPITAVAVSADGRRALSGQNDGAIRYWGLPPR